MSHSIEEVKDLIRRKICARVAVYKSGLPTNLPTRRHASTYAFSIIVAAVAARYSNPDECRMVFVDDAIILAGCVLVLEASMHVKLLAVEAEYRLGDLSNVMTWLAVILGACGLVTRLIQHGAEEGTVTDLMDWFFRMLGLELVLGVMMGSIVLILFGEKLRKRAYD